MRAFELLNESKAGNAAMTYQRSNRYPDGSDIPESLPPRYQPASNPGVPKDQKCSNCSYYDTDSKKCDKFKGDPVVKPTYWCAKWELYVEEVSEAKQRLDPKCWKGKHKEGTKMKGGIRVNNCVPNESVEESVEAIVEDISPDDMFNVIEEMVESLALEHGVDADDIWEDFESVSDEELYESAAWRRKEGKSKKGGLNAKGVASYRRENPGSKLQTAVTTKPSKLKKGSKAAKRRKSFCARMGGVKGPMKKPNGKPTRKALALRKWNC